MQPHRGTRAGFVARGDCFDNTPVFPLSGQYAVLRLDQREIAVKRNALGDLGMECGQRGDEESVAGRLCHRPVQRDVLRDAERALFEDAIECAQGIANPAKALGI